MLLFLYFGFLYFLVKLEVRCLCGMFFGFKFLFAFVFGTISFAIYVKVEYDEILVNVDVLYGVVELFLMMMNVFIVFGFW